MVALWLLVAEQELQGVCGHRSCSSTTLLLTRVWEVLIKNIVYDMELR